jgi:hypothetical protein
LAIVFAVAALLSHGILPTAADTVTWTGGGADTNWGTGANWDSGSVPAAADTAMFTSTATVTLAANHTIEVINFGANTLTLSGTNALTLNPAGAGNIVGTSGGVLRIAAGAMLDVNGRTHSGNEPYIIEIAGSGVGGAGAMVNRGGSLTNTNGFSMLRLTADAAIGGSGRLDFGSGGWIDSQGYTLTKTGTNDTWLSSSAYNAANPSGTTNLPEVIVNGGLFGLQASSVLASSSNVTVNAAGRLGT